MPGKVIIPIRDIEQKERIDVQFKTPQRCVRCNATPAGYGETHRIVYRWFGNPNPRLHLRRNRSRQFTLRFPLCEDCYRADYLTNPQMLQSDPSALGKTVRKHGCFVLFGIFILLVAIFLIVPIIERESVLGELRTYWWIPLMMGLCIFSIDLYLQEKERKRVRAILAVNGYDWRKQKRVRVEIHPFAGYFDGEKEPGEIDLHFLNSQWAGEFAKMNQWSVEED
jgi:hypothetical protein